MLSNLLWFCLHLGISSSRSDSSVRVGRVFEQRDTTFSNSPGRKITQLFFGMVFVRFLLASQKHTVPKKHKRRGRRFKGSRSAQSIMVTHVDSDRGCTAFCDLQNHGSSSIHHKQCSGISSHGSFTGEIVSHPFIVVQLYWLIWADPKHTDEWVQQQYGTCDLWATDNSDILWSQMYFHCDIITIFEWVFQSVCA